MNLDSYTSPEASEKLTSRLWRRYGAEALGLLEDIREDPNQADILIKGTEYIRCEIQQAKRREMIVKLEDFLRRRSKSRPGSSQGGDQECRGYDGGL